MSLGRQVGTDSTVSAVSSSATFGCTINLNVINHQVLQILGVAIGFKVVHKSQDRSDGLLGPSTESLTELSSLTGSTDSAEVFGEGNTTSMSENILEVLFSFGDGETLDGFGSLIGILIMDAEISA